MPPRETSAKTQKDPSKNSSGSFDTAFDRTLRLFTRFERFSWDLGGVALLAVAAMTLVALVLPGLAHGFLLSWWSQQLMHWFGWGSVWVVSVLLIFGLWMLRRRYAGQAPHIYWGRIFSLELAAFSSLALLSVLGGNSLERANQGLDGGAIGWGLSELLRIALNAIGFRLPLWQGLLLGFVCLVSVLAGTGLLQSLSAWAHKASTTTARPDLLDLSVPAVVSEAPLSGPNSQGGSDNKKKRSTLPSQFRKNFRVEDSEENRVAPPPRDDRLPPLELLYHEQTSRPDERNINLTAGLIEKTLSEFGIPAKVVGFRVGPTVTQFAVEPGFVEKDKPGTEGDINRQKVRVAQIAALHRDLALALSAERLRIEAPVPGRPFVGIEVPNLRSTLVRLRPILESEAFFKLNSSLTIGLGRDVSGAPVVADLTRMPHLLIAGTTGSGKSVCIAAITTCLVMNNTPEDLRLVMVDPKMVELVRFNGLPHLLGKVETDLERILAVLRWTVAEMDRRYKLLEASRSRNIDSYNRKAHRRKGVELMPRIVLLIDELADLMMSAPDQTEHNLVRLAQMARATGIHLVVATQRPSTDVVTGLIKANFPARISFAVASSIDSRVILDSQGAEALLGRGDMLFLQPDASAAVRSQGVMVTDQEIERVITFWQKTVGEEMTEAKTPWDEMLEEEAVLADRDDLVEKAVKLVRESQRASASLLQRRLRIGYPRAARLIDELEELGVIGPPQGGGRDREVLVGPEDGQPEED
jgi:S-DNA-T family DNA segregation ATPase FtsK/SpoIIIE